MVLERRDQALPWQSPLLCVCSGVLAWFLIDSALDAPLLAKPALLASGAVSGVMSAFFLYSTVAFVLEKLREER
jgi:hypothetical protein